MSRQAKPAQTGTAEGIVTSDMVTSKSNPTRILLVGGILIVVILLCTGSVLYVLSKVYRKPAPSTASQTNAQAQGYVQTAQNQVAGASSAHDKAAAYYALGNAYLGAQQPANAISAFQNALKYAPNDLEILEGLAAAYQLAGDKTHAIATLQQVVAILQQRTDTTSQHLLGGYRAEIAKLQGGQ